MNKLSLLGLALGGFATTLGVAATVTSNLPDNNSANAAQVRIAQAGTPLAQELQGKPVFVEVYASWCPGCRNISKTVKMLEKQYGKTANFVVLDVTDKNTTKAAEMKANKLGLSDFFMANKSATSTVAIIDPATGMVIKQFRNNPNKTDYMTVLDSAIAQIHK
ncbi:MAG: TlpA family protein disulfide reductase [Heteroscytonema crispum UTEX LB 1556]